MRSLNYSIMSDSVVRLKEPRTDRLNVGYGTVNSSEEPRE